MDKLNSDKLRALRALKQADMRARVSSEDDTVITVAMGTVGLGAGARDTMKAFLAQIEAKGLANVIVRQGSDSGQYGSDPLVEVSVPGMPVIRYKNVTPDVVERIVNEHVVGHSVVADHVLE